MTSPNTGRRSGGAAKLNLAERKLLNAVIKASLLDLRTGDTALDDPSGGATWGEDRTVRAELLIKLLTTTDLTTQNGPVRAIKLQGARITGPIDLEAATLTCPLMLRDCYLDEPVNLDETTAPAIRMPGCCLPALTARYLHTTRDLQLNGAKFTTSCEVNLAGAHIGGQLNMGGVRLASTSGRALLAVNLTVDRDMFCNEGFTAEGEVHLHSAHIGGQLHMSTARLTNVGGTALAAANLTVDQDMRCRGLTADGKVNMSGAHIGGQLDLTGATLSNTKDPAMAARYLIVGQDMHCDGVTANGQVDLDDAHIGGTLSIGGSFTSFHQNTSALYLHGADVAELHLTRTGGNVNLINARVGRILDDPRIWPTEIYLKGLTYDSLDNHSISTRRRLKWLALGSDRDTPQVYDQLAAAYRRAGDEQAARKVAIAKQRRRRSRFSPLSWLWYLTVGYGYRPWLAGVWVIALAALGTVVFSHAYPVHMIATKPNPPSFHAIGYTLDLLLPVIGLGQKSAWQPQGSTYQYWSWAFTGAGWVLTTAVVAGLTGMLKRD